MQPSLKARIIAGVVTMLLIYLAFSFGNADFNIGHWVIQARMFCGILMLFAGIGVFETKNDTRED